MGRNRKRVLVQRISFRQTSFLKHIQEDFTFHIFGILLHSRSSFRVFMEHEKEGRTGQIYAHVVFFFQENFKGSYLKILKFYRIVAISGSKL